jgi:hypothetical protein
VSPLTIAGLPAIHGVINSVAINSSGNGIIGGRDTTGPIYAALVSSSEVVTPLTFSNPIDLGGIINSVSINDSGTWYPLPASLKNGLGVVIANTLNVTIIFI